MDNNSVVRVKCKVCHGKGGWQKNKVSDWREDNWQNCYYCDMLGFVVLEQQEETSSLMAYNGYKKIITDLLEDFGKIINYTTLDMGKTVTIDTLPDDRNQFITFVQHILKRMYMHNNCKIEMSQMFFHGEDGKIHYHWRIVLKPNEITDLDGFVDHLREWANIHRRRR